jgi:DNA-binding GntR family transcriptional regulator
MKKAAPTMAGARAAPKPLARAETLGDRIYDELRKRLQHTPLQPEERLVDVEVAAAYGTSRMPARDALLRLVNEGYLVGTTRGFVAPTLSLDDVRDIFEVRCLLEPAAIASVASNVDAAAKQELTLALKRARQAAANNDDEEMALANMAFRQAWLSRVKNQRLANTIGRFVDHVQTVRLLTLVNKKTRQVVVDGLSKLHAALVKRDAALAFKAMERFMADAQAAYFSTHETVHGEATPAASSAPATATATATAATKATTARKSHSASRDLIA